MNNKERGERIRRQILRDLKYHPNDIAKQIAKTFSITPQAVNNHMKRLEKGGGISSTGSGKGKRYFLGDIRENSESFSLSNDLAEDKIWRDHYSYMLEDIAENVVDICHYGFTEMVNNVIDHSDGTTLHVSVSREKDCIVIIVIDDGEGIFNRIKRLCNLTDDRQALLELSKGKLTTDPENHTGEGIFFTSRVFDKFDIDSKGIEYTYDHEEPFDLIYDIEPSMYKSSTLVYMVIQRNSNRKIQDVFNKYTEGPEDFKFNKTVIPVRLAQYKNEKLVSRSQAKRILIRVEKFENVIFDFAEVKAVGQAFADEIFRVYAQRHSEITLTPVNMVDDVKRMIKKAIAELDRQNTKS